MRAAATASPPDPPLVRRARAPRPPSPLALLQVDSIKELVTDTNLECSATGIMLQAMDSSHVALVSLSLKNEGFDLFRCDRNISLGLNLVRGGGWGSAPFLRASPLKPTHPAPVRCPRSLLPLRARPDQRGQDHEVRGQ